MTFFGLSGIIKTVYQTYRVNAVIQMCISLVLKKWYNKDGVSNLQNKRCNSNAHIIGTNKNGIIRCCIVFIYGSADLTALSPPKAGKAA